MVPIMLPDSVISQVSMQTQTLASPHYKARTGAPRPQTSCSFFPRALPDDVSSSRSSGEHVHIHIHIIHLVWHWHWRPHTHRHTHTCTQEGGRGGGSRQGKPGLRSENDDMFPGPDTHNLHRHMGMWGISFCASAPYRVYVHLTWREDCTRSTCNDSYAGSAYLPVVGNINIHLERRAKEGWTGTEGEGKGIPLRWCKRVRMGRVVCG